MQFTRVMQITMTTETAETETRQITIATIVPGCFKPKNLEPLQLLVCKSAACRSKLNETYSNCYRDFFLVTWEE